MWVRLYIHTHKVSIASVHKKPLSRPAVKGTFHVLKGCGGSQSQREDCESRSIELAAIILSLACVSWQLKAWWDVCVRLGGCLHRRVPPIWAWTAVLSTRFREFPDMNSRSHQPVFTYFQREAEEELGRFEFLTWRVRWPWCNYFSTDQTPRKTKQRMCVVVVVATANCFILKFEFSFGQNYSFEHKLRSD